MDSPSHALRRDRRHVRFRRRDGRHVDKGVLPTANAQFLAVLHHQVRVLERAVNLLERMAGLRLDLDNLRHILGDQVGLADRVEGRLLDRHDVVAAEHADVRQDRRAGEPEAVADRVSWLASERKVALPSGSGPGPA